MLRSPCRVLLIEDELEDLKIVEGMLSDARSSFFQRGFELTCAETLSEAKQILSTQQFDVILLDLMLPDSRNMNSLQELQRQSLATPIIVQTALEDEIVAVKALELGACGYLPKVANDRNLLIYAMRSAIERQQQLADVEQPQPQQELDNLEQILNDAGESKQNDSLKQRMPDIFSELEERYGKLLDRFVEQKLYKVEYELSEEINVLIEQLGYLQATPKDAIELHTAILKRKQVTSRKNSKALMIEGRYLLLELMGKLAAYYRRYYIGLNKLNFGSRNRGVPFSG